MKTARYRSLIYDDVIDVTVREREEYNSLNFDDNEFMKDLGVSGITGEKGYSTLERRWARPTVRRQRTMERLSRRGARRPCCQPKPVQK